MSPNSATKGGRYRRLGLGLLIATMLIGATAVLFVVARLPEQPAHDTTVRITRIIGRVSRWQPYIETILVQTNNGVVGEIRISDSNQRCNVGDELKTRQIGVTLEIDARRCRSARPLNGAWTPSRK